MASKKTVSSISFNTSDFLKSQLDQMIKDQVIYFYAFIRHYPEEDTKKEHFHFFLSPSKPIDFIVERKRFIEPVPNDKPLCCLPFQPSKLHDWLLYSLHDINYLNKKGLLRLNHYSIEEVQTNDSEFLLQSYFDAKETMQDNRMKLFLDRMSAGDSFGDILRSGIVPPNQIVYWEKVYASSLKKHYGKSLDKKGNLLIDQVFQPDI